MAKKLSLFMAAVALVAFAVPASASAVNGLTEPAGTLIPVGSKVEGTSTNWVISTSLGKLTCAVVTITGTVTTNTTTTVDVSGSGTSTASTCFIAGTKPITYTDITLSTVHATTAGSGTFTMTFVTDLPNSIVCHYSGTNIPFTYTSGTDSIKITNGNFTGSPAACEPGFTSADFTIETENGVAVLLD